MKFTPNAKAFWELAEFIADEDLYVIPVSGRFLDGTFNKNLC